jgi:hypothetical protein
MLLRNPRGGQARLIGLVVTAGIIVFAVYLLMSHGSTEGGGLMGGRTEPRFEGDATTTFGRSMQAAESVECKSNLSQLRHALLMQRQLEGVYPQSLPEEWGVALECPVSGQAYQYDPAVGDVWCTTPGHEDY